MIKKERSLVSKNSNSLNAMIKKTSMTITNWKPKRHTIAAISATFLITTLLGSAFTAGALASNGNPVPGVPHDTVMFHVQKSGPEECSSGKSAHIKANIDKNQVIGDFPMVQLHFTMIDWVDPDGDPSDGIVGNDEAYQTKFLDCTTFDEPLYDENNPPTLELQIGDKDPRKDWISTQSFFLRTVGIPGEAIVLKTPSGFYWTCEVTDEGDPEIIGDETIECNENGPIDLNDIQLDSECVHKTKGKGGGTTGKVSFCNVTESFLVDVDVEGDGFDCDGFETDDVCGIHIFQVGCPDPDPSTEIYEEGECPLGSALWEWDSGSKRFTLQMFIAHDGDGKVTKASPGGVKKHQK
jgi:hypothetical protein